MVVVAIYGIIETLMEQYIYPATAKLDGESRDWMVFMHKVNGEGGGIVGYVWRENKRIGSYKGQPYSV